MEISASRILLPQVGHLNFFSDLTATIFLHDEHLIETLDPRKITSTLVYCAFFFIFILEFFFHVPFSLVDLNQHQTQNVLEDIHQVV